MGEKGDLQFPTPAHLLPHLDAVNWDENWDSAIRIYLDARKSREVFEKHLLERGYKDNSWGDDRHGEAKPYNIFERESGMFSIRADVFQWEPGWVIYGCLESDEMERLLGRDTFGEQEYNKHDSSDIEKAEARLKKHMETEVVPKLIKAVSIPNDLFPSDAKGSAK